MLTPTISIAIDDSESSHSPHRAIIVANESENMPMSRRIGSIPYSKKGTINDKEPLQIIYRETINRVAVTLDAIE
jgi:hypothetical protein